MHTDGLQSQTRRSLLRAGSIGLVGAMSLCWLPSATAAAGRSRGDWAVLATSAGYTVAPNRPKPLPEGWVTGEVGENGVDAQDHLFTVNRRNLTRKEKAVGQPSWSSTLKATSSTPGLPRCFRTTCTSASSTNQTNVWMGGNQDAIFQKYTHDGSQMLLQIGTKGVFDSSDGTLQGTPLNVSKTLLNRPADIAVDPANGEVYIAEGYGNHRITVFDSAGKFVRQWGEEASAEEVSAGVGGKFRGVVRSVNPHDGNVYVCDRGGDRIQLFTKAGA